MLGLIDAGLGRKEDALREARRAVELVPVEKDALTAPQMNAYQAMIAAWLLGLGLAFEGGWFGFHWLQAKIVLVLGLSGVHGLLARWVRDFAADRNRRSQKFYRIINEIPAILMVAIVILAVVKPF